MTQKVISRLGQNDIFEEAQALQVLMSRTVALTTRLTSVDWENDAKTSANNGILDLSAVFGAPANIRAAFVVLRIQDGTVGAECRMGPSNGEWCVSQQIQVADKRVHVAGMVPCDSNGDFYIQFTSDIDHVWLYITGYLN